MTAHGPVANRTDLWGVRE